VIDTATHIVTATIAVGAAPVGVAVTPHGARVYVANQLDRTVSMIDTASNTVTTTVAVGSSPRGVAVTPDGSRVYVTNLGDNAVSVIDTASNAVTASVPVGNGPDGIAIGPSSQQRLELLMARIGAAGIPHGVANSLASKLDAAIDSLDRGDTQAAINKLRAFEHEVSAQSGKKIPKALATAWIALVEAIIANL
jgi:YVTN family beta-propeller protein